MADTPFVGSSNPLASRTASVARTVNLMPIPAPGNERVLLGFKDVEGLVEVDRTVVIPPPPSAWNPLDIISGADDADLPPCMVLSESNRLGTRVTEVDNYEAGVRGEQARGGVPGERWYLELELVNLGSPGTQNLQIGLIDDRASNVLSRPPDPSDSSEITSLFVPDANYLLAYSRTADGVMFASEPAAPTEVGDFGTGPTVGDIYSFEWLVGTSITVRRNNVLPVVVAFTYTGQLWPYFSAGVTHVNGPDTTGTGESCRIRTGRSQQSYTRAGATAWG